MHGNDNAQGVPERGMPPTRYRLPLPLRLLVILVVVIGAVLTILGGLPLARLLGVELSQLQGAGFEPTLKTMTIVLIYSASQFLLIWLFMRFVHRRRYGTLGFRGPVLLPLLVGTAIGLAIKLVDTGLVCAVSSDVHLASNIPPEATAASVIGYFLLSFLFLLTLNSLKEELVFRTYPIEQFNDHPRAIVLVLVFVSLVFAAVHHVIEPFRLSVFLSRFSIAMLFSYVYFQWRSIWLVAGLHNGMNLLGFLLVGQWKAGGLLKLTYEPPSPAVDIAIDLGIKIVALGVIHLVWKRTRARRVLETTDA
jgi:membrane protease YdiL (CAAX protease family)